MNEELVVIHVRFANDGSVQEIGERPRGLSAQAWFGRLWKKAGDRFQALAGGRGIFRLPRAELDALRVPEPEGETQGEAEKGAGA
ncbi:conserved protein of unknown function [Methylacidimicrobium sp. AP8]|uniref:hypothetical protein n=1 Tax=Methylacidimicrobium sp. AP8 TaxID=2730359 RepID=UPI0018C004C6|nr:hypothetical protein [Methylacidimicrobium sp. AP8]CAB4243391.1 conserved protein of unknown function [Methylacidimicrobium sp. AP8]